MKYALFIIGALGYGVTISAQEFDLRDYIVNLKEDTIQLDLASVRGINLITTREKLICVLGEPDSIVNPHYECGGFSEEWQQKIFLQYYYGNLNFIGHEETYQIELIHFDKDSTISLNYNGVVLNSQTRIEEMEKIFPKSYKNRFIQNDSTNTVELALLPQPLSDDKVFFWFINGRLYKVEYWTSC